MKPIKLYISFVFLLIIFSCNDDEENFSGTGTVNFSLEQLQEVENATSALAINIGVDNFNHAGGTISVAISGATYGTDYETSSGSDNFTLTIGEGGLITSFSIQPIDNDAIEANKELTITLTDATGALILGENTTLSFTILEDDDPLVAVIAFENAALTIQENVASATTIFIPFDQETTEGGTITIEATGDAVLGTDYTITGQTTTTFTLPVSSNATNVSFEITAIDNTVFEADKSVVFTITETTGGLTIGNIPQLTVSIENDDSPPNPLIDFDAANTLTYNEDTGTITLNFELSNTTTSDAAVELTTSGTTDANDFNFGGSNANPYSFTIPSGSSAGSVAITITDDAVVEMDETLTLTITNVSGGLDAGVNLQQQTLTITDNDAMAFSYVEDFESGTDLATLGFENILNGQTVDPTKIISLITSNGNFSDVNNVNGTSNNGLNMFYNAGSGTTTTELLDNVLVSPIMNASGNMEVIIDNSYAFFNQNSGTVTYYWSQTYNGSGTFNEADWTVMGTETAANMNGEGFGNNTYKQQQYNINPSANFYIAIRVSQTMDASSYRTRWRFDNLKVNSL
ncbi:Calx-beta domain-containing protein [uncultured Kordia sp.]|uniref:Calx-beta domain-containing protein n=1 Tax=uncultured Kordia sp. TaxID=507699 RepID=UPI002630E061|nr:Calx-beta domain-containing protein [uncultured Kordia sp.]